MIVPRNKLLLWVAMVVLPFAFLGLVEPSAAALALGAVGALFAAALFDAARAPAGLAGLSLRLPAIVRMSKDRETRIAVRVRNERQQARTLRVALVLPQAIQSPVEDVYLTLPPAGEWSSFAWGCCPRRRGRFRIETARLEVSSPWGFWSVRQSVAAPSELRVYPNLAAERKNLAVMFLHRGAFGLHSHRQLGKGREFEKLREYVPGDGYDEIHWKATARRARPITKTFQIERTQEVYLVIDASRLSARPAAPARLGFKPGDRFLPRPSPGRIRESLLERRSPTRRVRDGRNRAGSETGAPAQGTRNAPPPTTASAEPERPASRPPPEPEAATTLDRFLTAALVLGQAAEQQGDRFGLLTFTDKVERFLRASNGKAHYGACRDALYTLQPHVVTPDFEEVCTFIRLRLRRRALLVFLTALDDPVLAESFVRTVDLLRRQHLVMVNMLQPPGVAPVFSNPDVASVDGLYEQLGGHLRWQNLLELGKVLQRHGVRFSLLRDARLSAELVSQYLSAKRRQLL